MKIFGGILVLLSALIFSFCYSVYEKKRLAEEAGICRFLCFVQNEFLLYGTPLPKIAEKCKEPQLTKNGYLKALADYESADEAFIKTRDRFSVSAPMLALFSEFSEHFGRESCGEEEKHLALWCASAKSICQEDENEAKSRIRLAKTLAIALSIGILLLFL